MKQRARARHQRVCRAVPVDESCPPQLVVNHPAVLEAALRHCFNPDQRSVAEQLRSTPSTKADRFRKLLQVFEDTIIASHQAVRAKSHEATNKSTPPACLSSHPHRRELSPTARRRPFCCSRRSCPTPLQPSHRQQPGYSTAKSHEATSLEEAARHRFSPTRTSFVNRVLGEHLQPTPST